jgi:NAD(P)-dependent dehydrogenase (short-subunit alcohol dehydrogenase family)
LAAEGYDIFAIGRSLTEESPLATVLRKDAPGFRAYAVDAADPGAVSAAVADIDRQSPLSAVVYNASAFQMASFEEIEPAQFEAVWRASCLGAMVVARACLPRMAARGAGAALFTGATASLRGGAKFAAFASAKFALRGLVQSLAREYGPRGVHVAHFVIDGLIGEGEGKLAPDEIAAAYLAVLRQPRSAWMQEADLRPYTERF